MRKAKIIKGDLCHALRDDDEVYVHSICPENGKAIVEISDGRLFNVDIEDIQFKDPPEPERGITHLILSDKQYISLFTSLIKTYEDSYTIIDNKDTLGFVRYLLIPTKCPIIINWNWEVKSQTRSVKMISGTGR